MKVPKKVLELDNATWDEWSWDCYWYLAEIVYNYNHTYFDCPNCNERNRSHVKEGKYKAIYCNKCKLSVSPLVKTVYGDAKIPIAVFLLARFILENWPRIKQQDLMAMLDLKNSVTCSRVRRVVALSRQSDLETKLYLRFYDEIMGLLDDEDIHFLNSTNAEDYRRHKKRYKISAPSMNSIKITKEEFASIEYLIRDMKDIKKDIDWANSRWNGSRVPKHSQTN